MQEWKSRFLHYAVPFGFAQGPAAVGMTTLKVSDSERKTPRLREGFFGGGTLSEACFWSQVIDYLFRLLWSVH